MLKLKHKQKKINKHVCSSCAYAYVTGFTNKNRGNISTCKHKHKESQPFCQPLSQEMVFCACVCPYACTVWLVFSLGYLSAYGYVYVLVNASL